MNRNVILPFLILILTAVGSAQTPVVEMQSLQFKTETAPGSGKQWLKIICQFTTTVPWTDGMGFTFDVLLVPQDEEGKKARPVITSGSCAFTNIPAGTHQAIMYLTPNALLRYGTPQAATVIAVSGDDEVGYLQTKEELDKDLQNWKNDFRRISGILLPLRFTPFIITDYDLMPDPASF